MFPLELKTRSAVRAALRLAEDRLHGKQAGSQLKSAVRWMRFFSSFTSISKSDRFYHVNLLDRCKERSQTRSIGIEPFRRQSSSGFLLMALLAFLQGTCVGTYADPVPEGPKVLVIFPDQALRESEWKALLAASKRERRRS